LKTEKNITVLPLSISSYRVDSRKTLKPYAFMAAAQEAANVNATALGYGYSHLLGQNITWVLSRMKVEYVTPPRFMQETVIRTWQKGMKGPFSIRDFEIRDARNGDVLVRSTTSWLLIDLGTRELVRMDRLIGDLLESTAVHDNALPTPCGKIKILPEAISSDIRTVRYSDIDYNLHVNNAKYMEWALDALDPELVSSRDVASWEITFNHEAHLGDMVDMRVCATDPLSRYVEGKRGEDSIFQSIITFR